MNILGLQKLTLLDYPGRMAAIVFLGDCNFRCPFCQNSSLVLAPGSLPHIGMDEFTRFLHKRSGILEGICVTGGEPTLHRDLPDLFALIKSAGYLTKLDTNGTNPDMLRFLLENELLDYVAMDIKAAPANYGKVCGLSPQAPANISGPQENLDLTASSMRQENQALANSSGPQNVQVPSNPSIQQENRVLANSSAPQNVQVPSNLSMRQENRDWEDPSAPQEDAGRLLANVKRSVDLLKNSSIEYEFRTTVVKGLHSEEDFEEIAAWLSGCRNYYLQSFRDCPEVLQKEHPFTAFSEEEIKGFLRIVQKEIPQASLRGI